MRLQSITMFLLGMIIGASVVGYWDTSALRHNNEQIAAMEADVHQIAGAFSLAIDTKMPTGKVGK